MLYATIIEMLLLPLQLEAKRRIIDYMGVDTDAEGMEIGAGREAAENMMAAGKSEMEKESTADKKETEGTAATREGQI